MPDRQGTEEPVVAALVDDRPQLWAARALADQLQTDVLSIDNDARGDGSEPCLWRQARQLDQAARGNGGLAVLKRIGTALGLPGALAPLHPGVDLSAPDRATRKLHQLIDQGLGRAVADQVRGSSRALITTHPPLAIAVEQSTKNRVFCVLTDCDLVRHWAPLKGRKSNILYLVPTRRAFERLCAYGVLRNHVHYTGLPIHPRLLGEDDLGAAKSALKRRMLRLDSSREFITSHERSIVERLGDLDDGGPPEVPRITVVVDGTSRQRSLARDVAAGFEDLADADRIRLAVLDDEDGSSTPAPFDLLETLSTTDVLWTRPSSLVFFGALGLPLLLGEAAGPFEQGKRRWALRRGVAREWSTDMGPEQLERWLVDGSLADAAWSGYRKLPKRGTYRIAEIVKGSGGSRA